MSKTLTINLVRKTGMLVGLTVTMLIGLVIFQAVQAFAAYGRPGYNAGGFTAYNTYFRNTQPTGAGYDVLPRKSAYGNNAMPNMSSPGELINFLKGYYEETLNNDSQTDPANLASFTGWRKTGSAFIGWTMLGVKPGNMGAPGTPGSRETAPDWNEISNRLNDLQANGLIDWNSTVNSDTYGGVNTRYMAGVDDVQAFQSRNVNGQGIVIRDYNGNVVYVLRYKCGNPLGDLAGLPAVRNTGWTVSSSTAADKGSVNPGETIRFSYNIHNNGPGNASLQYGTRLETFTGGATSAGVESWPVTNEFVTLTPGQNISSYGIRDFTVPLNYTGDRVCSWISWNPLSSSDGNNADSNHVCVGVNAPVISCGGVTVTPNALEPNTAYTVTANISVNPASQADSIRSGSQFYIRINGPGVAYNNGNVTPVSISAGTLTAQVSPGPTGQTGDYVVSYGLAGGRNFDCPGSAATTFTVSTHPYFSVLGGDVLAGAGFGDATSCVEDPTAKIRGFNAGFKGAGTQLAAIANAQINGFSTGTQPDTGTVTALAAGGQPGGLAFANTDPSSLGNMGGMGCVADYVEEALHGNVEPTLDEDTSSVDLATMSSGIYVYNNNLSSLFTIHASGQIPANRRITLVVYGNAVIDSNIIYGAYANMDDAPNVTIIVDGGNLHIAYPVTRLDGFYVVKPEGVADGTLSTCSDLEGGNWVGTIDPALCSSVLTINGAVSAKNIQLNRTANSLSGAPTEVFQFSPEVWAGGLLNCGGDITLCSAADDYLVSLPPVL